ncbi:LysR family transcriptional regulator [Rhodospirillum sp. A1_3_36]|uniref:LysR family transcriptional regulator n=1 Tax=Rhodospirillum sp. A1_3_36 TaxID=3391666 RepID=UPI0039A7646A
MSLRALRGLVAIGRHGGFARAAEALGLTQATISLRVKQLEEDLRVPLFDRSARSPQLTEAGLTVLRRAETILTLYDNLATELSGDGPLTGTLDIGTIQTLQSGFLPQVLATYRTDHPAVIPRVFSGMSNELSQKVEQGELDMALLTAPPRPPSDRLRFVELFREPFYVLAPLSDAGKGDVDLLSSRPLIRMDKIAWAGRLIDQSLKDRDLFPQETMLLNTLTGTRDMVASGLGVAIVPLNAQRKAETESQCWLTPFGDPPLTRGLGMLERVDHPRRRLTATLLELMQKRLAEESPPPAPP